ncbi:small glutamine-rich tetratricopeptide repeat-containing protein alpha isoform X5 [Cinclus cinclus]|uniref:small glutamine-rich tetratricopeptide repeat-containing protein alpha isoform X5 n=1 Tax=Cinclus cinclus TaxID=127875 RepID=UPI002E165883
MLFISATGEVRTRICVELRFGIHLKPHLKPTLSSAWREPGLNSLGIFQLFSIPYLLFFFFFFFLFVWFFFSHFSRAAAYSKLGNYAGAVRDCERAIGIDPGYSKAYGRMGLALSSLNKHTEAVVYYRKALELDPDNGTYRSNLQIAEQKMRDTPSPTGGPGGFDLAGLLNNPGFMSMASNLMNNPQVQQLMSGMISGGHNAMGGAGSSPSTNDLASLIQALLSRCSSRTPSSSSNSAAKSAAGPRAPATRSSRSEFSLWEPLPRSV